MTDLWRDLEYGEEKHPGDRFFSDGKWVEIIPDHLQLKSTRVYGPMSKITQRKVGESNVTLLPTGVAQDTAIETHPDYPFVKIGPTEAFFSEADLSACSQFLIPGEWWIEVNGDTLAGAFASRDEALNDVPKLLFSDSNNARIARFHLALAVKANNFDLAISLAKGIWFARVKEATPEQLQVAWKEAVGALPH